MYSASRKQEPQLQEKLAEQHVAELNAHAKEMEAALNAWENEVKESRRRFYALNYYTTRQLLQLRKELGLYRHNPHRQIDPEVLVLLQSISPAVTVESVHSVLMNLEKVKVSVQAKASHVSRTTYKDEIETQLSDIETPPLKAEQPDAIDSHLMKSLPVSTPPSSSEIIKRQLTEQDLTDVQKQILTDLVEYQGYPRYLVLKAFEECGTMANNYDIQVWCGQNESLQFDDGEEEKTEIDDTTDSSDEWSSESDSSDVEESDLNMSFQQSPIGISFQL